MSTARGHWTLERELCRLAGRDSLERALTALGLVEDETADVSVSEVSREWLRGGAETYVFRFRVTVPSRSTDALLKACVAFSPGRQLERILDDWIARRKLLSANGVNTPKLYGYGHGILIEEYVEYSLTEALSRAASTVDLEARVVNYAASLSRLGFAAISPFEDLRSRGTDVVVVDFGQDLGPPNVVLPPQPTLFDKAITFLRSAGVSLTSDRIDELNLSFNRGSGERLH